MAVTIKDVAREAGVSTATVSKVMNGSYTISERTVKRVQDVMKALDYHPNARARSFARQSAKQIVFLTVMEKGIGFQNPHMFEIVCGLENVLSRRGYTLAVKSLPPDQAVLYLEESFSSKEADGYVIHAAVISMQMDELIEKLSIPHVVIGTPSFESHFSWIDVDNRLAGEMAARHLFQKGYMNIAFIGGKETDRISSHRLEGVVNELKKHDIGLENEMIRQEGADSQSGYGMAGEILCQRVRPDAIVCANNYIAYGCLQMLQKESIRVPKDIGIITFDDFPFSQVLSPRLTVVNIDVYEIGTQVGRYITQKIKKKNLSIQSYITAPILIERESTKKEDDK